MVIVPSPVPTSKFFGLVGIADFALGRCMSGFLSAMPTLQASFWGWWALLTLLWKEICRDFRKQWPLYRQA
ncbi:MAG: hypothetical protein AB4426_22225 [Xenococcaceae cyanobacterium]